VLGVEVVNPRPEKGLFSLPGLFLLALVFMGQRRRRTLEAQGSAAPGPA
jgi:hypothetical protein